MAEFTGDINVLFDKAFGIYTNIPVYFVGDSKPEVRPQDGKHLYSKSSGMYLFDRFGFLISEANLDFSSKEQQQDGTGATVWDLPEATVVQRSRGKNIVETVMPGKDGTVKELVSMGDWEFVFRGFIINKKKSNSPSGAFKQTSSYPREYVQQMSEVFAVNQSLRVYSRMINDLVLEHVIDKDGKRTKRIVDRVVITSLDFPVLEGYDNVQPYELTCLSDSDIVLEEK